MKKFFLLIFVFLFLISAIINSSSISYPVFQGEINPMEEFSNDEQCLNAVRRLSSFFPAINSAAVLNKNKSVLCGISTGNKSELSKAEIEQVIYNIFPEIKALRIEINTKRADDIMELSYLSKSSVKKKYISSRFDFLISED